MTTRLRLIKLVRDRVGGVHSGRAIVYRQLSPDEIVPELRKKLLEEVGEYLQDPSLKEMSDIYEVMTALCQHELNELMANVQAEARRKFVERGGFGLGMGMYVEIGDDRFPKPRDEGVAEI